MLPGQKICRKSPKIQAKLEIHRPNFLSLDKENNNIKMPKGPISSPPIHPKKAHGVVDDDAPIDDYEGAVHDREHEDVHRLADEPNVAAARRANKPPVANSSDSSHSGATGSKNRSKSGH
ncbi:hypothetical protein BJX70DRAFT_394204 [Aspergillus crustosus]